VVVVEAPRELPVLAECDVLVVGAGPAGLSAALGAKRAGADVILMERFGCFGGVITTVGMETLGWYRYEGTVDCEGIGREMERVAERMGGTKKWPYNDSDCLDADAFKIVADKLVQESGVRPLLHCMAVEVIFGESNGSDNGQSITGVVIESKSGRQALLAKRVVDCTGEADIAHLAGCEYVTEPTSNRMSVTQVFNCAGVDKEKILQYTEANPATYSDWSRTWEQQTDGKEDPLRSPYLDAEFEAAERAGVIPEGSSGSLGGSWSALSDAGEANNLNLVHMSGYDCTDVQDLTRAEIHGRSQVQHALAALQHSVPGFEKAKLRNFGMTLGTRDSRKIRGRYSLTEQDVKGQARFHDTVGTFPEFIDGYNILILPTTGRYFQVPYGCLVPEKSEDDAGSEAPHGSGSVDNLLVAGRCVAGDKVSHAAMRNMMACTVTGQAAGVVAAVSIQDNSSTRTVDVCKVQEELKRQGVRLT
jgi:hypothetical protein